jgi:hypothetical protein
MKPDQIVRAAQSFFENHGFNALEWSIRTMQVRDLARMIPIIKEPLLRACDPSAKWSGSIQILPVRIWQPYTSARMMPTNTVVTLDVDMVQFIALLNEALICGSEEDGQTRNLQIANVLYWYALQRKPPSEQLARKAYRGIPEPPKKPANASLVASLTLLHLAFILAHEIGHIAREHLVEDGPAPQAVRRPVDHGEGYKNLVYMFSEVMEEAEPEIEADYYALMCCFAAFVNKDCNNFEDVMRAILQLSRYFLWLDLVITPSPERIAVARHYALQNQMISLRGLAANMNFISQELDWLDENAGKGVSTAIEAYERVS